MKAREICFSAVVGSLRSLVKYFQHSRRTFVSPRDDVMPFVYISCFINRIDLHILLSFSVSVLGICPSCIASNLRNLWNASRGLALGDECFPECWSETKLAASIREELRCLRTEKFKYNSIHCALEWILKKHTRFSVLLNVLTQQKVGEWSNATRPPRY